MTDQSALADAYDLAAKWHDKNAKGCEAISRDEPRIGQDVRKRAAEAATHHRGSAAGLRLAAVDLRRKELPVPRGRGRDYDGINEPGNGF